MSPSTLHPPQTDVAFQRCINLDCGATYGTDSTRTSCDKCGDLLDIDYHWDRSNVPNRLVDFERFWTRRYEPLRFRGCVAIP